MRIVSRGELFRIEEVDWIGKTMVLKMREIMKRGRPEGGGSIVMFCDFGMEVDSIWNITIRD